MSAGNGSSSSTGGWFAARTGKKAAKEEKDAKDLEIEKLQEQLLKKSEALDAAVLMLREATAKRVERRSASGDIRKARILEVVDDTDKENVG